MMSPRKGLLTVLALVAAIGLALRAWSGPERRGQIFLWPVAERTVAVTADAGWVDTGIDVALGDTVVFRASGEIDLQKGNPEAVCGPEGLDLVTVDQPIPDVNLGALVGKFAQLVASRTDEDSGLEIKDEVFVLFLIGAERVVGAPFKGRLYLGINENVLKDNAGEFTVALSRRSN
jgi:hypothetical protein